jgi:hypothetical protein
LHIKTENDAKKRKETLSPTSSLSPKKTSPVPPPATTPKMTTEEKNKILKNRAKELISEHKLKKGTDLDKTIIQKTAKECSVSTRLLTKMIDLIIHESKNEQEESKGAQKLDDMFGDAPVADWGAPVSASPSVHGASGDVLMKPPSENITIKTENNRMKTMSESSDNNYSADVSDSIFNQMKKPETEFGKITPVQKRPQKNENSNVEFGSLAADLFKPDDASRKLNLSDSDSSESDSDSASSESDDEDHEEIGNKKVGNTKVESKEVGNKEVGNKEKEIVEASKSTDESEMNEIKKEPESNDKIENALTKDQSENGELQAKEVPKNVQNETSIHSQLEMSDESRSFVVAFFGDNDDSFTDDVTD